MHDSAAGSVTLDVENAALAMRRLAAQAEMAFEVLIERHAVAEQVLDAVAGLVRQEMGDLLIDDTGAGADGVGGMRVRIVAVGDCCGNARLGPEARCAFAEPRRGDHGHRERRKLQRGKQAGKARADNDDAAARVSRRHMSC